MACPLPGMDPYLEDHRVWPTFHHYFALAVGDALLPVLPDRYRLKLATRTYTIDQILFTSVQKEEHKEDFVEIRLKSGDKLITLLDLVSPTNRTHAEGRRRFELRRGGARRDDAHLIEIELATQGTTCLEADLMPLADRQQVIVVHRAGKPTRLELYGTTYRKRLPRIRVPLQPEDRDLTLDLQSIFARAYDRCSAAIDYAKEPPVQLDAADAPWLLAQLKAAGLR